MSKGLAFQLRSLRDREEWSQVDLAAEVGMTQNAISRLENPNYGKATLTTLKRIAAAFDVGLIVRFVPFSQLVKWTSGTPYVETGLSPETMNVPSFEEEEKRGAFDIQEDATLLNPPQQGAQSGHPLRNPPEDITQQQQHGGETELQIDLPPIPEWTKVPPLPPSGDMGAPNYQH